MYMNVPHVQLVWSAWEVRSSRYVRWPYSSKLKMVWEGDQSGGTAKPKAKRAEQVMSARERVETAH